jgi:hypothetical protein
VIGSGMTHVPICAVRSATFHSITFIGTDKKRIRCRQTKNIGGLEIDLEVELGRLLHRQIGRRAT